MGVRVRCFAAIREAAGVGEVEVEPGSLDAALDDLCERFGPDFAKVLEVCTILLDGQTVRRGRDVEIPDGAELALLPPVSGGARAVDSRPC